MKDNTIICRSTHQITVPVLFLVFNRIDLTKETFEAIRKAKPQKLYIASDGARESRHGEGLKVDSIREFVLNSIDWECEVKTLFRKKNLGCKNAISEAIDWVFENEDKAIILEDDCVPSMSFFYYCQEMLEKYEQDDNIMHISGTYYLEDYAKINSSYYLSKLLGIWGWATWKRAWRHYDSSMEGYTTNRDSGLILEYFHDYDITNLKIKYFDDVFYNQNGTNWDPVWAYAIVKNNAFCISPTVNLVKNTGFQDGIEATHGAIDSFKIYSDFDYDNYDNISHPDILIYNLDIDTMHFNKIIKVSDPACIVFDYKHYARKVLIVKNYPRYLRRVFEIIKKIVFK
jgi:hypothetical protein